MNLDGGTNKVKLRRDCNFFLENIIELFLRIYPDLRYIQALWALRIIDTNYVQNEPPLIIDRFDEEPIDTVKRILPRIIKLVNEDFPEKPTIVMKILRCNIFTHLEELGLAAKTADFKLVPKE